MISLQSAFDAAASVPVGPTAMAEECLREAALKLVPRPEVAELSLREYIEGAWQVVEPATPYVGNWHIDAIADHLEAVTRGEIKRLLVNVPPRHSKSLLCSVFWPTWVWTFKPQFRWLYASYAQNLSTRDARLSRNIILSRWYQERWGNVFSLTSDQNVKTRYENDRTGYRIATSVGGTATGDGGDAVVVDDPHNAKEVLSETKRQSVLDWWDQTMSSRLNDPKTGAMVIIMQRLHESDLSGHVLESGDYEHLCLPAEYEPTERATSIGWSDPRTEPGELLNPERYPREELDKLKRALGSYGAAGQLQQRPAPAGGGIFKIWWLRFWKRPDEVVTPYPARDQNGEMIQLPVVDLPVVFDEQIQSWDMTFKDAKTSDFVVGQVWGRDGANCFLLDQKRQRMDFPATVESFTAMSREWPEASAKLVEDKANGSAVIATLRNTLSGIIAVNPKAGKVARAHGVSPRFEAGNVFLPHPSIAPWVEPYIHELTVFPGGKNDDQVDATTQALDRFEEHAESDACIGFDDQENQWDFG